MKTIVLDIETWSPDWHDGEHGWDEGSMAPTAFHEPVAICWLVAERTTTRSGADAESSFSLELRSRRTDQGDEAAILQELREDFLQSDRLVTWNGRSFDMPVLSCRALHCGVDWRFWHEWRHRFSNYKTPLKHYDLLDQLGDFGAARGLRLDRVAKLCGAPGKQGMHGSDVPVLWAENKNGDRDRIELYCQSDVINLWLVYLRFARVFFGIPAAVVKQAERATLEEFKEIVSEGIG